MPTAKAAAEADDPEIGAADELLAEAMREVDTCAEAMKPDGPAVDQINVKRLAAELRSTQAKLRKLAR